MPKKHFKTNLFFSIMIPRTPTPTLSRHVHRLIIRNKTKKGHNLVCLHPKNYPYNTEFVSWCVHHFSFFIFFPIRWGGGSAPYWKFPIILFFLFLKPSLRWVLNNWKHFPKEKTKYFFQSTSWKNKNVFRIKTNKIWNFKDSWILCHTF